MLEAKIRTRARFRMEIQEKAWEIGARELLLLVKALEGALVNLLSIRLTSKGFQYKL